MRVTPDSARRWHKRAQEFAPSGKQRTMRQQPIPIPRDGSAVSDMANRMPTQLQNHLFN
jgi:hypothetical protein